MKRKQNSIELDKNTLQSIGKGGKVRDMGDNQIVIGLEDSGRLKREEIVRDMEMELKAKCLTKKFMMTKDESERQKQLSKLEELRVERRELISNIYKRIED